jgi:hypothetical protein
VENPFIEFPTFFCVLNHATGSNVPARAQLGEHKAIKIFMKKMRTGSARRIEERGKSGF